MEKKRKNIIYICIWEKAKEKTFEGEISMQEFVSILHRIYHVPKKFVYPVIKEMEQQGFLKWINRRTLKILEPDIDLEDTSALYKDLGFF